MQPRFVRSGVASTSALHQILAPARPVTGRAGFFVPQITPKSAPESAKHPKKCPNFVLIFPKNAPILFSLSGANGGFLRRDLRFFVSPIAPIRFFRPFATAPLFSWGRERLPRTCGTPRATLRQGGARKTDLTGETTALATHRLRPLNAVSRHGWGCRHPHTPMSPSSVSKRLYCCSIGCPVDS